MRLVPYKWNGVEINDTTNYITKLANQPHATNGNPRWTRAGSGQYPKIAGKEMGESYLDLNVYINKSPVGDGVDDFKGILQPDDSTLRVFICKDADDSDRQWYVNATVASWGEPNGRYFTVKIALNSPIWLTVTTETEADWAITASGQTNNYSIDVGNIAAYPTIELTITAGKAGGQKYRRFIETFNYTATAAAKWHVMVQIDHAALVTAGKSQADGRELRVMIGAGNGNLTEIPYWIPASGVGAVNRADTKIWFTLPYSARSIGTLTEDLTDVATSGFRLNATGLEGSFVSGDLTNINLLIEDEIITAENYYRGNRSIATLSRGAKGTTAAAHAAGTTVRLIPEIWLLYGSSTLTAPTYSLTNKPIFNLSSSTNTSWVFENMTDTRTNGSKGAVQFSPQNAASGIVIPYTSSENYDGTPSTNPAEVLGMWLKNPSLIGKWNIALSFGFTDAVVETIKRFNVYNLGTSGYSARIESSTPQLGFTNFAVTTVANTFQTTASLTHTPAVTSRILSLVVRNPNSTVLPNRGTAVEFSKVTITHSSATTDKTWGVPSVTLYAEEAIGYELSCRIENTTTGDYIEITDYPAKLNKIIRINTLEKTAIFTGDDRNDIFSFLSFSSVRDTWLKMIQGTNTLKYTETGVAGAKVVVKWQGRNN